MSAPWKTSTKTISFSGRTEHQTTAAPTAFAPPALGTSVSVTPSVLFAAMAKMQALRTASQTLILAVEQSATALTEAIVDDATASFNLSAEAEMLESTARAALAGAMGVGMCHVAMLSYGYVWNDFAAAVMPSASGKALADFVYDGGAASGHGVVLVEAKGSLSVNADAPFARTKADDGYTVQVARHIGKPIAGGSTIVHGYAVAFAARLPSTAYASGANAFLHVAETKVAATAAGGSGTPAADDSGLVSTAIALGNYRADFALAGAPVVVAAIDALRRSGDEPPTTPQRFTRIETPWGRFLKGESSADAASGRSRFMVDERIARPFLRHLSALLNPQATSPDRNWSRLRLPIVRLPFEGGLRRFSTDDQSVVFPDGLAYAPGRLDRKADAALWLPREGFIA